MRKKEATFVFIPKRKSYKFTHSSNRNQKEKKTTIMADTEQKVEETPAAEEPKKTTTTEEEKPVENGEEKKEAVADGEAKTEEAKDEDAATEEAVENHENGKEGEGEEEEEETPAPSLEAPTENPFTDEDVQQLLDLESGEEGWDKVKEKKGAIVYRKSEKNSTPLIKVRHA